MSFLLVNRGSDQDCWPWMGTVNNHGYGYRGRKLAHRLAYEQAIGPIPDGLCVLHTCDNPPCCNPAHLFLGTKADNTADMMAKGRNRYVSHRGEANGNAKLTQNEADQIRALSATNTQRSLAKRFGVSRATVSYIVNGMRYAA